jgi:hypothetical protein
VVSDEWAAPQGGGAAATTGALDGLPHEAAHPELARQAGASLQVALVAAAVRLGNARSTRLSLRDDPTDGLKWGGALVLGLLAQIGVAVVHLERWRAQALALAVSTLSAVVLLGVIAACERPFHGGNQVSAAPLESVLRGLSN